MLFKRDCTYDKNTVNYMDAFECNLFNITKYNKSEILSNVETFLN